VRVAGLAAIVATLATHAAIGACGAQDLVFDVADAAPDAAAVPKGCSTDQDCPFAGLHCDALSGQCVACVSNVHCTNPAYGVCNQRTGSCVGCTSDAYCQNTRGAPYCDTSVGQCVECLMDSQCPQDHPRCDGNTGRCVECLTSQDCPSGAICDTQDRTCQDARSSAPEGGPGATPDGGMH